MAMSHLTTPIQAPSFWENKRVLVGGGCGFLGSYLVPQLVGAGAKVMVVDNLENGFVESIAPVRDQVEFREGDLRDRSVCDDVTRGQDIFINLAAKAFGMDYSQSHASEMLTQNLLCTLTPLEAARYNRVERVVVLSSSCVYPDEAPIPTPELPVFSGLPEKVNEGYGWAKRMQELAGTYYARDFGMKVTILRPFNMYGGNYRWGSQEKAHVIPVLVKRILDGEDPVMVWGSGQQRRNFLHGADAAHLMLRVIAQDVVAEPINIGYDDDTKIADLVDVICEVSGRSPRIVFDRTKPEGQFRKCADARRLRELTQGYVPRVSLRDGIAEMVEWYRTSFGK
jgi:nucleoside-diphosphate-sugar epimerase